MSCTPISANEFNVVIEGATVRALRKEFGHEHSCHTAMLARAKQEKATVHDDLRAFKAFLRYLGPAPSSSHTIDRTNNSDPEYAPGKVRWATKAEQAQNRDTSITLPLDGEDLPLPVVAERTGQKPDTLRHRLKAGWRKEETVAGTRQANAPLTETGWPSGATASTWDGPYKGWLASFHGKQPAATRAVFYAWISANRLRMLDRCLSSRHPEFFSIEASSDDSSALPNEIIDDPLYQNYLSIRTSYAEARSQVANDPAQIAFLRHLAKSYPRAVEPRKARDAMHSRF